MCTQTHTCTRARTVITHEQRHSRISTEQQKQIHTRAHLCSCTCCYAEEGRKQVGPSRLITYLWIFRRHSWRLLLCGCVRESDVYAADHSVCLLWPQRYLRTDHALSALILLYVAPCLSAFQQSCYAHCLRARGSCYRLTKHSTRGAPVAVGAVRFCKESISCDTNCFLNDSTKRLWSSYRGKARAEGLDAGKAGNQACARLASHGLSEPAVRGHLSPLWRTHFIVRFCPQPCHLLHLRHAAYCLNDEI